MSIQRAVLRFLALFAISTSLVLAGCAGSSAPSVSVVVTPASATLIGGASTTFAATVSNDSANAGVTWTASIGTITSLGAYTAPAVITTTSATVTATSKTDSTKTGTATVTLTPISVGAISPSTITLNGGGSQGFTATVSNDGSSSGVTWSIGAGVGTLSNVTTTGVTYTAPAVVSGSSPVTVSLVATSIKDPTKSSTAATITLTPISVGAVSPATITLNGGGSQGFTAAVSNDGSSSGVTWSIGAGVGTLSNVTTTGVTYNAPAVVTGSSPVTVSLVATSIKDPSKSSTAATITLTPITVTIPTTPVAMIGGVTQSFTATVGNDGSSSGVTWSATSGGGSFAPTTTASGAATAYTSASPVTTGTAVITATSIKDPTKSASATITLTPIAISLTSPGILTLDGDGAEMAAISAAITGDGSASGATFTVTGAGGTMRPVTASGNAPSSIFLVPVTGTTPTSSTITVTSVKDPTKSTTVVVILNPRLAFTTPVGPLPAGTTNTPYSTNIVMSGGTGARTFSINGGNLPSGVTMDSTGVFSGTPNGVAGTYNFTVLVTDQASVPATLAGLFKIVTTATPLVWTLPSAPATLTYTVGTPITPIVFATTGGTGGISYSLSSGTLPAGLSISGNTLSGTPTAATVVAGNAVTFQATDSATVPVTTASAIQTLVVNPITLTITPGTLPTGTVGASYSYQFTATGGTAPITWTLSGGSLAGTGLSLSSSGLLSGTPLVSQTGLSLTFQAKDSATNQQQTKTVTLPLTVSNALAITTASLPGGTVGNNYTFTMSAAGGSGTGYTWAITSGQASLTTLGPITLGTSGSFSGIPSSTGSATFTITVTDSSTNTASTSFTLNVNGVLTLPAPNPSSLPGATVGSSYNGAINATGGFPPYTWTVNGTGVPTNGSLVALSNGLSVSNTGSGLLSVTGTPTAPATVSFTAKVTDSASTTAGPFSYTVAASTTYNVNGQVSIPNFCGGSPTIPPVTLTLTQGVTTIQTTSNNTSGGFTFAGVPNGTYTVTPSISGPSAVFYPASQSITINNANPSFVTFNVGLGYTVSGTVSYAGSKSGQVYLTLNNTNCGGGGSQGTSLVATGPLTGTGFTIRGVPPGTYSVLSYMDALGFGASNAADPTGTSGGTITVSTANATGAAVTLTDPAAVTLSSAPSVSVGAFNNGILAQYNPITSSGVEQATSYVLQWSTTSNFATIAGSKTFAASGNKTNVWFLNSASTGCTNCSTLTNGSTYYFELKGVAGSSSSSYGVFSSSGSPVAVTIGQPAEAITVTGTVSFSGTATGPLYAGFYNQNTGTFYGEYIASPVTGVSYSVQVPSSSSAVYEPVAIIDQNNDGILDAGDIQNVSSGSSGALLPFTANSSYNITLPSAFSAAAVVTQNNRYTNSGVTSQNYYLDFQVQPSIKRPVSVTLQTNTNSDGANVPTPMDVGSCISNCGGGFDVSASLGSLSPTTGDNYTFNVTYSDASTGTVTATVTGVVNAFATNLQPNCNTTCTSTSTQPTFTWTYPSNPTNYTYSFSLCCSSNSTIWQIPDNNSNSNGFSSSQITSGIPWITSGNDALGESGNVPTVTNLSTSSNYSWEIETMDSNGNSATQQVNYQP